MANYRNDSLDIMRVASNLKLKDVSDETLVSLCQEDIDLFRHSCVWECNICKNSISYSESLIELDEKYIHELKCSNVKNTNRDKCKGFMSLKHKNDYNLNSIYFDELLARYQDKMISEAMSCKKIEDPYEVYSIIIGFFMKIIGKFARDKSFLKTSHKWFSTYFWTAMRNKTIDIRKSHNYIKRSPSVICEVCGKEVGQINSRHLFEKGHESLLEKVKYKLGDNSIKESGEINYYKDVSSKELHERCVRIGETIIDSMDQKSMKDFLSRELYKTYSEEYPHNVLKNTVVSLNETINESDSNATELGDVLSKEKDLFNNNDNKYDEDIIYMSGVLIKNIIEPNIDKLREYFFINIDLERRVEIIRSIIINKTSYCNLSDKESDCDYKKEVKKGLTAAIFKLISSSDNIKETLGQMRENFV